MSKVSYISLGCPKALVDSEHIVTALADEDFSVVGEEEPSGVVVINTCGFINHAKAESYSAIEAALDKDQKVVVTGCLGVQHEDLLSRFPNLGHVSGPGQTDKVVDAVRKLTGVERPAGRKKTLSGRDAGNRTLLTPEHYAYLKISEGCNHKCSFCIIPTMRGGLKSRAIGDVVSEAEALAANGVKELMLIAQDLSAYGLDTGYATNEGGPSSQRTDLFALCQQVSPIVPWIRLHYVYPYPHVDKLVALMAENKILPYLDMPLQHASPSILKSMRRPAAAEKTLDRIQRWRSDCPDLSIRSNFIVGFPGETEKDLELLLEFLDEAKLDRVGCFTYSEVDGAKANAFADQVDEREKLDRQDLIYEHQSGISRNRLNRHLGKTLRVMIDGVLDEEVVGRTAYDAPDIDGLVYVGGGETLRPGDLVWVKIISNDDYDLRGEFVGNELLLS